MSRTATLTALTAVVALAVAAQAHAGHGCGGWKPAPHPFPGPGWEPPAPTSTIIKNVSHHSYKVAPSVVPSPQPIVGPRSFYFGMSLQITYTQYGRGLQVASITPGSPAARAGLEIGDVLLRAGSTDLQNAYSNEHGVQLLQSAVLGGGGPAPTVTAFVAPSPSVYLTVVNVRTGQLTGVNVQPIPTGSPAPTLTAPAPVASNPSPAVSAF